MFLLPHRRPAVILASVVLTFTSFAPRAKCEETDQPVQKVYDIRDLLVQIPDLTDAPHLGIETHQPSESAPKSVATRNELIERQIEWIRAGIGSDAAQIALTAEEGKIKVTAKPEVQQQIEKMLAKARGSRATQVEVEIRELILNGTDELSRNVRARLHEASAAGQKPVQLNDEDVQELLKGAQANSGSSILTAPRVTVFDGQRAYVMAAQQKAYRAGVGVSEINGRRVTEPLTSSVSTGMVMKVRPAVDEDGTHIALDLQFEDAKLLEMRKEPAREPGQNFGVEVPVIERVQVDRTLSTTSGRTVLIAIPPATRSADPGAKSKVLLVKPTVIRPETK